MLIKIITPFGNIKVELLEKLPGSLTQMKNQNLLEITFNKKQAHKGLFFIKNQYFIPKQKDRLGPMFVQFLFLQG